MKRFDFLFFFLRVGWPGLFLVSFVVAALNCATTAGKQASAIAEKCGAQVAADVVVEVSQGLDTSQAALEADALKYGVPLVLCVIGQLVVIPPAETTPSLAAMPPITARQRNAAEFMAAHR